MAVSTSTRKPLGIRATPKEHATITRAAAREGRSVNSFVLSAALEAAHRQSLRARRTPEQVRAILEGFRATVREVVPPNRNILTEFLAERRAEAARE
jgi:uncharacterized protein (DUF1778 family)